mmetsp:Transcript_27966/g.47315  ORF Transcript_27966/g.47315 Transcript_27966/m.47315 type:complete len:287 (-) Transcript_27966:240-1100(-)
MAALSSTGRDPNRITLNDLIDRNNESWSVFPPRPEDYTRLFAPGSVVWVMMSGKPFAKAVVVPLDDASGAFQDRIRVKYNDGSFYHCRPQRLRHIYGQQVAPDVSLPQHRTQIVVTAETKNYRHLAQLLPCSGESALEIGSDLGSCTGVLQTAVGGDGTKGGAVGVDKSPSSVKESKRRFPHIPFHCIDVLAHPDTLSLLSIEELDLREILSHSGVSSDMASSGSASSASSFDVVFVDINGNRMLEAVVRCIHLVFEYMNPPPRLIVVKSTELTNALLLDEVHSIA